VGSRLPSSNPVPPIGLDDLPIDLATALRPRVERLGYLGEFFQRAGHQPDALLAFHRFTEVSKQALGEGLTEVVALTVSVARRVDYERNQHQRLAVQLGRSRAWIAAVERLEPGLAEPLDDQERHAQATVLAVIQDDGHGSRSAVEGYAERYGAPAAVALLLVVGRYVAHAVVVNALEIEAPVPSIFEEDPDGR